MGNKEPKTKNQEQFLKLWNPETLNSGTLNSERKWRGMGNKELRTKNKEQFLNSETLEP
jgi:hypothetical protein